jgi:hypothetical protein
MFAGKAWVAVDADCGIARVNRATHARAIAYRHILIVQKITSSPLCIVNLRYSYRRETTSTASIFKHTSTLSTRALAPQLSAFLFLNFYGDFQVKILYWISYTNFQNPCYRDFQDNFFLTVFGPRGMGWPFGGAQRLQRVCARRCAVPGNTPNSNLPPTTKIGFYLAFNQFTTGCVRRRMVSGGTDGGGAHALISRGRDG